MKQKIYVSKKRNKSVLLYYLLYIVKLSQTWENFVQKIFESSLIERGDTYEYKTRIHRHDKTLVCMICWMNLSCCRHCLHWVSVTCWLIYMRCRSCHSNFGMIRNTWSGVGVEMGDIRHLSDYMLKKKYFKLILFTV